MGKPAIENSQSINQIENTKIIAREHLEWAFSLSARRMSSYKSENVCSVQGLRITMNIGLFYRTVETPLAYPHKTPFLVLFPY
jgi:hypothetical protein